MSAPDVLTYNFMRNPSVFADAFNLLLFGGKPVIQPQELTELDPTMFHVGLKKSGKGAVAIKKQRDILKKCIIYHNGKQIFCLLGIENQALVDPWMAVRTLIYDALAYNQQMFEKINSAPKKRARGKDFLLGLPDDIDLIPVVTLVCYFGQDPWNVPTHLHGMLKGYSPESLRLIPDHFYLLLDLHTLPKHRCAKLKSELRAFTRYMQLQGDRNKLKSLLQSGKCFQEVGLYGDLLLRHLNQIDVPDDIPTKQEKPMNDILLELKREWEEKAAKKATEKAEKAAKRAAQKAEMAARKAALKAEMAVQKAAQKAAQKAELAAKKAALKAEKEGKRDGRESVAINMLKSGKYSQTAIAKATNLSYATVKKLAESLA